jgi:hypothetical protein
MSYDLEIFNLIEYNIEPLMTTDGPIASDSEAEREAVHLANGEFENDDQVYDDLAMSFSSVTTSQCDVMWSVTQGESSPELSFRDPDSRDDSLENICAAITDDVVEPVSVNKLRKIEVKEKEEDVSLTYFTTVCQVRKLVQ